jgi:hypothetical protein
MVTSEALFGSAARGDADRMSDRDVLIVDDSLIALNARTRELEAAGWSVASYTFSKLEALASRGALFLQHLKLEAQIVRDSRGRLGRILAEFKPKENYAAELIENGRLAALAGTVPVGARGTLLAADILFVAVRNFGILTLAERGIHLYSYGEVVKALEEQRFIRANGASALSALRFLKCLYRSGEEDQGTRIVSVVNRALGYLPAVFPPRVRLVDPQVVLCGAAPPDTASAYFCLRDLELRLTALSAIDSTVSDKEEYRTLLRWISNPRAYAALSNRIAPALRQTIADRMRLLAARPKELQATS